MPRFIVGLYPGVFEKSNYGLVLQALKTPWLRALTSKGGGNGTSSIFGQ
jgi:hypothetical protein